jgi:hypothetical protein
MAVGLPAKTTYADGDVFSASDINDTNGTLNLVGQTTNFYAGKNRILNSDFSIWQRGTSISLSNGAFIYTADRFLVYTQFSAGTSSVSRQTFTPGTAPVSGYESPYFARITCGSTATYLDFSQRIEDVRTFAGQTATLSFWAKSSAAIVLAPFLVQGFGSGGSSNVNTSGSNITLTTSWVRYSITLSVPSVSGKTIGAGSFLSALLAHVSGSLNSATVDFWGWQLEAGATATAFQTATGTIQGELAACQRYYQASATAIVYIPLNFGTGYRYGVQYPVTMRIAPTVGVTGYSGGGTQVASEFISTTGFQTGANSPGSGPYFTQYTASAEL